MSTLLAPSPSFAALAAASASTTLQAQKRALRKSIWGRLAALEDREIEEQSRAITARVLTLPFLAPCTSISCYLSMPSGEARTGPLVETILESGKHLYVPKIASKEGSMDFLRVYDRADVAALPGGTWGIKEPGEVWNGEPRGSVLGSREELDVILVPGVAFDRTLSRLGHGKGYYDRFVTSYVASGRRKPLLVGLSLREQLLELGGDMEGRGSEPKRPGQGMERGANWEEGEGEGEERKHGPVPTAAHDWKVDVLVTPDETIGLDNVMANLRRGEGISSEEI